MVVISHWLGHEVTHRACRRFRGHLRRDNMSPALIKSSLRDGVFRHLQRNSSKSSGVDAKLCYDV
eukprot:6306209-Pyramimonas_sp.AAC.1